MKRITLYVSCLLALFLAGCEKVIEFDISDINPKIVVQSTPVSGETMELRLNKSHFFLVTSTDEETNPIEDATITLTRNGEPISLITNEGQGLYTLYCKPQPGDHLNLKVEAPDMEPVTSQTVIPQVPQFEVVEFLVDTSYNYANCRLKIKIIDPQGENFYEVSADYQDLRGYYDYETDRVIDTLIMLPVDLTSSDVVFTDATSLDYILNEGQTEAWGTHLRFSDNLFDGKEHTMTFTFSIWYYSDGTDNYPIWHKLKQNFRVTALSKELYQFEQSREMQANDILILSEPTQIQCNIVGGMGIFGGKTEKEVIMEPTFTTLNYQK